MRFAALMCLVLAACDSGSAAIVPGADGGGVDSGAGLGDPCGPGEARDGAGACVDIDACQAHPCADHAICADLPAPALDDEAGRTCACPPGHDGDGDDYCSAFAHPGLLHTDEDFERMRTKVAAREEPWLSGWNSLVSRGRIDTDYAPRPVTTIYRPGSEYSQAIIDTEWAYARALAWKITGDEVYADAAIAILDAWSSRVESIDGSADRFLAAGILGFMFANIGEIMRDYEGWSEEAIERFRSMLVNVFYPMNHLFINDHNGTNEVCVSNYWANWDLYTIASLVSIGVFAEREDIYREGVDYLYHGRGNGSLWNAVWYVHPGHLGQWQESGRDQGHTTGGLSTIGSIAQILYNQGHDLFAVDNNRLLAAAEFVARSNLIQNPEAPAEEQVFYDIPWQTYGKGVGIGCGWETHTAIGSGGRGNGRPLWELWYNHYVNRLGLSAPYVTMMAERMRPDGFSTDEFGYTTLTFSREPIAEGAPPSGLVARTGESGVQLSWWGSAYAESYRVQRSSTSGGPYEELVTIAADADRTYLDAAVTAGEQYFYVVSARTASGELTSREIAVKVGVWPFLQLEFDASEGATDESPERHTAGLAGGAAVTEGRVGNALSLDGVDDHIALPDAFWSDVTDFTLSTWIQLRSEAANQWLLTSAISRERYLSINLRTGSGVRVATASVGGWHSESGLTSSRGLPIGQWAHLAITLRGNHVTIYIDGENVGEGDAMNQLRPADLGITTQNWIGRSAYPNDPYLNAVIEDFRIYRGGMTADEVAALAQR